MGRYLRVSLGLLVVLSLVMGMIIVVSRAQPTPPDMQAALHQIMPKTVIRVGDVITQFGKPMCFEEVDTTVNAQTPTVETSYDLMFEHYIIIIDSPRAFSRVTEIIPLNGFYHVTGCYPSSDDETDISSWRWQGFRKYE